MSPDLGPDPGWILCEPLTDLPSRQNFVASDPDGDRIRIAYYRDAHDPGALCAKVWYGAGAEGPPRHAHGGALMAVLDELLGGVCWVEGRSVVLAHFEADMRRPVPLGTVVRARARIARATGRKVHSAGAIVDVDGTPFAEATGLFIELDPARIAALAAAGAHV